jgi:hypothetical protein
MAAAATGIGAATTTTTTAHGAKKAVVATVATVALAETKVEGISNDRHSI